MELHSCGEIPTLGQARKQQLVTATNNSGVGRSHDVSDPRYDSPVEWWQDDNLEHMGIQTLMGIMNHVPGDRKGI